GAARLSALTHRDSAGAVTSIARYLRDGGDERRVIWSAPLPQVPTRFDYDGIGRLRHVELDIVLVEPPSAPDQAGADAVIASALAAAGSTHEDYTLTRTDARSADERGDPLQTETYALTATDQISQLTRVGGLAPGNFPFVFDGDGRCIQDDRYRYTYDALGRLVGARLLAGPLVLQQEFDGASRVVRRTENAIT